nr:protein eva-1-like isoform X2 [Danaus plexippus plexippus]
MAFLTNPLLSGTLKTMQRAACDDEMVSLSCPPGTLISIQIAQYGKVVPGSHACIADVNQQMDDAEEICLWPNEMQYSLLRRVVEACQKKPQCKFSTKLKPEKVDPCPLARKFVEVAYKCRPHEFRSRTGCEDDVIKLSCNQQSRVAIYDAQYGRLAYETVSCPKPQGVSDESNAVCSAPYAVETVMQICHGKRYCQVVANNKTFGSNCNPNFKSYFKVVYACVPLGVLTERYESATENDRVMNTHTNNAEGYFDESDTGEKWKEPNGGIPIINPVFPGEVDMINPNRNKIDDTKITFNSHRNNDKDSFYTPNTKFLIYVSIGIIVVIILIIVLILTRYYKKRDQTDRSKNGDMFTTETPNIFSDNVSDLDVDVDVSQFSGTFYDPAHPDMILYKDGPNKATLRAMKPLSTVYPCVGTSMYGNVDYVPPQSSDTSFSKDPKQELVMSPKSLGYANNQYFYG